MNKLAGNFLICWLGWGIPMGLLFCIPAKGHAVRYCRRFAFCSHNDFVYSRPVFPER